MADENQVIIRASPDLLLVTVTMANFTYPPLQKETYTLTGTGAFLLTDSQRNARTISVTLEKVLLESYQAYFNFRVPEPQSFWGYYQWMDRDFELVTDQLEYRRQEILSRTWTAPDEVEQLRCLVRESALFLFDNLEPLLLGAGLDAEEVGSQRANYILNSAQRRLIPSGVETSLWYEIQEGFAAQLTIIWGDYPKPCGDLAGRRIVPKGTASGRGDSSVGPAPSGGGIRPAVPVPPNRRADPDSDSPAPPPATPAGPPSPSLGDAPSVDERGPYRVTLQIDAYQSGSAPCVPVAGEPPRPEYLVDPGPATLQKTFPGEGGYLWKLFDADGAFVANVAGASLRSDCESGVIIVSQLRQG